VKTLRSVEMLNLPLPSKTGDAGRKPGKQEHRIQGRQSKGKLNIAQLMLVLVERILSLNVIVQTAVLTNWPSGYQGWLRQASHV
jgi:hypothetical protein